MQLRLIHTPCKLKKLFPYKDKQPYLQQLNDIYQLKCDCGASYIAQIRRNLITRLNNYKLIHIPAQNTKLTIQTIKSISIIVQS